MDAFRIFMTCFLFWGNQICNAEEPSGEKYYYVENDYVLVQEFGDSSNSEEVDHNNSTTYSKLEISKLGFDKESLTTEILCDETMAKEHCNENALCIIKSDFSNDSLGFYCVCKMGFVDVLPLVPGRVCKATEEMANERAMLSNLCLDYCFNEATCFVINHQPLCSCANDFSGSRCEIPNLIGFLSLAVPIVFVIVILLIVIYFHVKRYCKKSAFFNNREDDDDDPETNTIVYKRTDFMASLYNP